MPIYEFRCEDCKEEFEVFLKNKEELSSVECKKCKSKRVKRLISVVNSIISDSGSSSDKPRITESHSCATGSCTHIELPGYGD
ncbi:zinc ribbon domain-containing protein [Thermodesulfobacterium sp. TA1]|uniref:FmdB family zinc ribbon protein n=1 Tax=Thermodesulfobacterium sp. TA1 TaxID=2234087 RepID=UPI001231D087|nr:zinc ribbon domain-containing protein [Thermodesulfobacterium sp. TA1]QER41419.1 zinc ribbon domain-containing protein [Thermodesulfobacterium sp. TA1]